MNRMNAEGTPWPPGAGPQCPDCRIALAPSAHACPHCALSLVGPTAQRLWWIDAELVSLDRRRDTLLAERPRVLERLRRESSVGAGAARSSERPLPSEAPAMGLSPVPQGPPPMPGGAPSGGRVRDSAQNVILGLGALLIGVAALVFVVWNWSTMGTGARATVLGAITLAFALPAPPLYRRGLRSTAETFGIVAAGLLCLDALALWFHTDGLTNTAGYTAAALAVIGSLLALYRRLVPLRSPSVLIALFAQPIPLLLVLALPVDTSSSPAWILASISATALADAVVLRLLGPAHPGAPLRTLRAAAIAMWTLTLLMVVPTLALLTFERFDPWHGWGLVAALLPAGAAVLLLARPRTEPASPLSWHLPAGLATLTLVPLAAGPPILPALPRTISSPGGLSLSDMAEPAVVLSFGDRAVDLLPPASLPHLIAIPVAALLALGVLWSTHRRALPVLAVLLAPVTLLPLPLLAGASQSVVAVGAAVLGGGLVLLSAVLPDRSGLVAPITGALALVASLVWALPERYTTLTVLVIVALTAMICALGARRYAGRRPHSVPSLFLGTALTWGTALVMGLIHLIGIRIEAGRAPDQWWLLGAVLVLLSATVLVLAGTPLRATPSSKAEGSGRRDVFEVVGLALLTSLPLVVGPPGAPVVAFLSRSFPLYGAPVEALTRPAHEFVGLPDSTAAGAAVALGALISGAVALLVVALVYRRPLLRAAALLAPGVLVPLPFALGLPFVVALVWTLLVGSVSMICAGPIRRVGVALVPWTAGAFTLLLATSWALSERYSTVGVLLVVAVTASVSAALARTRAIAVASTATATFATGAFAFGLLLTLDVSVEYAAFGPLLVVAAFVAAAPRLASPLLEATEIPAAVWAALALGTALVFGTRSEVMATSLAVVGVLALARALHPDRRWTAAVGGILMLCALWTVLYAWDVSVPEAYTVPPALAFVAIGHEWSRRAERPVSSLLTHGGGLVLLLLPTVLSALDGDGMEWRVPAALAVGLAMALWGMRARLLAPLLIGATGVFLVSLRAFGPPLWDLTRAMPNWVPIAVIGLLLLFVGARYEAGLNRLRRAGHYLGRLR
ncbi:hypothetical protein ABZ617_13530 [Nocardiopsis alba]|uniref:SCO7613 C-terminal domain-containing membrane protein n=1 Tax=Nocardiopsis alba TaxID=53437 RepID=UPI0033F74100